MTGTGILALVVGSRFGDSYAWLAFGTAVSLLGMYVVRASAVLQELVDRVLEPPVSRSVS